MTTETAQFAVVIREHICRHTYFVAQLVTVGADTYAIPAECGERGMVIYSRRVDAFRASRKLGATAPQVYQDTNGGFVATCVRPMAV